MAKSDPPVVWLGNTTPLQPDGQRANIGNTITVVQLREGIFNLDEIRLAKSTNNDEMTNLIADFLDRGGYDEKYLFAVLEIQQLRQAHMGAQAAFVASSDPELEKLLADFFRIPAGAPDAMGEFSLSPEVAIALDAMTPPGEDAAVPPAMAKYVRSVCEEYGPPPIGGGSALVGLDEFGEGFQRRLRFHRHRTPADAKKLLVNAGRDALHAQHLGTAAQPAAFNYMAVSANSTAPSAASTTLPGEITTAGGGLLRSQATYAHSAGTNTTTLTKTFTGNASDSYPVTINKIGVLNAASTGTLGYETLLNNPATLNASGDNVAITHTLTIG